MSGTRSKMPGLRLKGGIWQIEKRCKYTEGGWLRESTRKTSRTEAEKILIKRLAEQEREAQRRADSVFLFEEAGLQYLTEIHRKSNSASTITSTAMHLDQLFPFIGHLTLEQIHDGTLRPFIDKELDRGLAPKTINNVITIVATTLNRAARVWRDDEGRPWLRQAPPLLSRLSTKGKTAKPYPLSWEEQDRLFNNLANHLSSAALFGVNTGCREQEICQLSWDWEVVIDDLGTSVFVLPEDFTKTQTERVVVLNSIAKEVVESLRGNHPQYVFSFRGHPIKKMRASGWRRAWVESGLPNSSSVLKGVHNLRHTFGRRLRAAGIALETRKTLLGHANGDITTHYSAAELEELIEAVEAITDRSIAQTPTLSLVGRNTKK